MKLKKTKPIVGSYWPIKVGDKITTDHRVTWWDKVRSWFGYQIPKYDYFVVTAI